MSELNDVLQVLQVFVVFLKQMVDVNVGSQVGDIVVLFIVVLLMLVELLFDMCNLIEDLFFVWVNGLLNVVFLFDVKQIVW